MNNCYKEIQINSVTIHTFFFCEENFRDIVGSETNVTSPKKCRFNIPSARDFVVNFILFIEKTLILNRNWL